MSVEGMEKRSHVRARREGEGEGERVSDGKDEVGGRRGEREKRAEDGTQRTVLGSSSSFWNSPGDVLGWSLRKQKMAGGRVSE